MLTSGKEYKPQKDFIYGTDSIKVFKGTTGCGEEDPRQKQQLNSYQDNEGEKGHLGFDFMGRVCRKLELGRKVFRRWQGVGELPEGRDVLAKEHLGKFCYVISKNSDTQKLNYNLDDFSEISQLG